MTNYHLQIDLHKLSEREERRLHHFAGLAMQSLINMNAPGYAPFDGSEEHRKGTATLAYSMARDMLYEWRVRTAGWNMDTEQALMNTLVENRKLKKEMAQLERKNAHGCNDAHCPECDGERDAE